MEKKVLRPKKFEGMSIFRPPLCYELTGRRFELVMDDGYDCVLEFTDCVKLSFTFGENEAQSYPYDCLKADEDTYFVNFEAAAEGHVGRTYILDLEHMLVTGARASMGHNPKFPRMTSIDFSFGAIRQEDGSLTEIRHGYTSGMAGKAVNWNYGLFEIVHVYSSERYYRVAFSEKRLERLRRENPNPPAFPKDKPMPVYEDDLAMIKIKDNLYLVSLSERILCQRNGHGNNLLFVMNFDTLHDVGRSYGTNADWQDENYTVGAYGTFFETEMLTKPSTYYIR